MSATDTTTTHHPATERSTPCLTTRQPWATFITLGVKRYETKTVRPPTDLVGRRVGIIAGLQLARGMDNGELLGRTAGTGFPAYRLVGSKRQGWRLADLRTGQLITLPMGAVVVTAVLGAGLPILGPSRSSINELKARHAGRYIRRVSTGLFDVNENAPDEAVDISDQIPYGDWTPGRYAWPLTDLAPLDVPRPASGRQHFVNVVLP